ncbi:hypothetical protein HK152_11970 [Streptococcus agalactiae]|nr:hypothetical protein [Streptococcus agalactiae]
MMVKKLYDGYTIIPPQDLWYIHVVLMKSKDYYFDAFAKNAQTNHYVNASFNLSGNLILKGKTISYEMLKVLSQVIHQNLENFRKEIIMDIDKNIEKIIRNQALALGELLKSNNTKDAWTKAGELNAMLKKEEAQQVVPDLCDQLRQELRGYYYVNGELNKLHKQLYAKGNKLIDLSNL